MKFNTSRKFQIIYIVLLLQVACITILCVKFYYKYAGENISTTWIDENQLILKKYGNLKYFYEPKPNSKVNYSLRFLGKGYTTPITYEYNSDTLRQKENISIEKPVHIYRIVTLGDSFTFGSNLNTEDTYPSKLQDILNKKMQCNNTTKFEVLNLGVIGYDIQYSVERFKSRGKKYSPDLIVWFIIPDDMDRLNELMYAKTIEYGKEMAESGELKKLREKGIYYAAYKRARDDVIKQLGREKVLAMQKNYMYELSAHYKKDLVIFTFPSLNEKSKQMIQKYTQARPQTYFYNNLINIYGYNGYFPDYHPNKIGTRMIAEDIYKYIMENNIVSCK